MPNRYAYRIIKSNSPKFPVGMILASREDEGKLWESETWNGTTRCFEPHFSAKRLGILTAPTDKGQIRQLRKMPGAIRAMQNARKGRSNA